MLPATCVVAMSNTNGASFRAGAAHAHGFVANIFSPAWVGTIDMGLPAVVVSPIMSCSSAIIEWYASMPM